MGVIVVMHMAGVDLGASNGRVLIGHYDGGILSADQVHRFPTYTVNIHGHLSWNIYSLFTEVKSGIAQSAQAYGEISSIGIDSWAVDYGLLNRDGQLLALPRHYRDERTNEIMKRMVADGRTESLFARTGIQLMPINTLFQILADMEQSSLLQQTSDLLLIPDLLNYFLTGQKLSEYSNATTTQLVHATTQNWDTELMNDLGIPRHLFKTIVQPGTSAGSIIDDELRAYSNLGRTSVVHVASHDTASAVLAVPKTTGSYAYISSGTWSLFGTTVDAPIINEETRRMNFTNEGGYGNYRFLKNIMGLWLLQQSLSSFERQGQRYEIEDVMQWVQSAPSFSFFFDVDDERLLPPGDMPTRIRHICQETNQTPPLDNPSLVRGILENLAYKYRYVLDNLETATGQHVETIYIVGGGCRNAHLCQFTANVTNRPVVAGPAEATAMGNLLMQLVALGELSGTTQMQDLLLRSCETTVYEPKNQEEWSLAYASFGKVMEHRMTSEV